MLIKGNYLVGEALSSAKMNILIYFRWDQGDGGHTEIT